ncbi:hypothetical protein MTO96_045308, partial [Rhipicephalus appendiculatus]
PSPTPVLRLACALPAPELLPALPSYATALHLLQFCACFRSVPFCSSPAPAPDLRHAFYSPSPAPVVRQRLCFVSSAPDLRPIRAIPDSALRLRPRPICTRGLRHPCYGPAPAPVLRTSCAWPAPSMLQP